MRGERGGSPARGARASLPLPRRLIRQIARHVASSGRSLRRLEVSGRVIDNFDDIEDASDESDMEQPQPACDRSMQTFIVRRPSDCFLSWKR
ncbi:hypothetical protein HF086_010650 [Spodoptera exigua]|uniref:Uncharacterized protein n=1 Tax=Spodoptera exigua TaxID=7107 RepID=A0A922MHJ7_SPOEX|nr:hypothetical protein HF086_010650 [Spodoptera exigua]